MNPEEMKQVNENLRFLSAYAEANLKRIKSETEFTIVLLYSAPLLAILLSVFLAENIGQAIGVVAVSCLTLPVTIIAHSSYKQKYKCDTLKK